MVTFLGWLRDLLLWAPHAWWQKKTKKRLRKLADDLESFRGERAASKPRSETGELDPPLRVARLAWQDETRRLFDKRFLPELQALQDDLDSREISDRELWGKDDLGDPLRLDQIVPRLRKLARRKRFLR